MQLTGYVGLLLGLMVSIFLAAWAAYSAWNENDKALPVVEKGSMVAAFFVAFSSTILLSALVHRDYSFLYVYENVDNTLSLAYTITAFWGGRAGSLLFWELLITLSGVWYLHTRGYQTLSERTRLYFWMFFLTIQAFFLLLLTCWSNPFIELAPKLADGRGLNPLLRNPGMIFHPPLLFMGFAGYTVPCAAALASMISGETKSWVRLTRNWNIGSWIFLTAGIILGGWWAYMELGWGGYWAWDPVENASLIPWFAGTAYLHTAVIESRRGALQRTNVFLISLSFILCVFSTYLTRSGVIESVHSFGKSGIAVPLFIFMMAALGITLLVIWLGEVHVKRTLSEFLSRQGLLVVAAWFFLAMGFVVTVGTMWPVISAIWSAKPVGLDAAFYNRVCLPFLSLIIFAFAICPWMGWKGGVRNMTGLMVSGGSFAATMIILGVLGYTKPLALFAAASSVAAMVTALMFVLTNRNMVKSRNAWGQYGIHFGVAMLALGIAISGPYKQEGEFSLADNGTAQVGDYTFKYKGMTQDSTKEFRARALATVEVYKGETLLGTLHPEKRIYRSFPDQQFAEVSVIPRVGDEIYMTLLGIESSGKAAFKASINPLVNWIWLGGTLMCVLGFLLFRRNRDPWQE